MLRIDPDGYVNFGMDDGSADSNHDRHSPIRMPGKEILVRTLYNLEAERWSLADFRDITDWTGRRVDAYFRVTD